MVSWVKIPQICNQQTKYPQVQHNLWHQEATQGVYEQFVIMSTSAHIHGKSSVSIRGKKVLAQTNVLWCSFPHSTYRYHKVMTWFVKVPSLVNSLARPKSASFNNLPPVIRRLAPTNNSINRQIWDQNIVTENGVEGTNGQRCKVSS